MAEVDLGMTGKAIEITSQLGIDHGNIGHIKAIIELNLRMARTGMPVVLLLGSNRGLRTLGEERL